MPIPITNAAKSVAEISKYTVNIAPVLCTGVEHSLLWVSVELLEQMRIYLYNLFIRLYRHKTGTEIKHEKYIWVIKCQGHLALIDTTAHKI